MMYQPYIPVSERRLPFKPRIKPVEIRKILWNKFGKKKVFVRKKQHTNKFLVYIADESIFDEVAHVCTKYEDTFDHPNAQIFLIINLHNNPIPQGIKFHKDEA